VAVAKRSLEAGETIDGLGGFCTYGLIESAEKARAGNLLPLGLAPGAMVRKAVEAGQTITYDDVEVDDSLMIVHLRRLQDLDLTG
jgi:predicted homoserine dehydrogenase-like protein